MFNWYIVKWGKCQQRIKAISEADARNRMYSIYGGASAYSGYGYNQFEVEKEK